ncbi:helix-turn-helix domain-containing protein [Vibrio pelagius]|uniref:Helix-turn-helix domain-containing protein n=1 Tax=Vibrio pelagius TaxID=28169 RepID=A0ABY5GA07_VIBPE|nr:helix-turn-helix domain-containing protein [Vibrio pelagius]UTT86220.1 helix-turn-helix domain-containing protein [Vibrio pelagius]
MATLHITQSRYKLRIANHCRHIVESKLGYTQAFQDLERAASLNKTHYAETIYKFIESVSELLGEDDLGFTLGVKLFEEDHDDGKLNRQFLTSIVQVFANNTVTSNYASYHIDIVSDRLVVGLIRQKAIRHTSRYIDEIFFGYFISMLRHYAPEYSPTKVIAQSRSSLLIPDEQRIRLQVMNGRYDVSINIPIYWVPDLSIDQGGVKPIVDARSVEVEGSLETIRALCKSHVTDPYWSVNKLAEECHLSVRTLQRLLSTKKVNFRGLMLEEKLNYAMQKLDEASNPKEVASELGFSDVTAFGRFFKKKSGKTITDYINK